MVLQLKEFFDIDVKTAIEVVDEVCEVDSIFLSVNEYDKLPLHEKLELDCLYIKTITTKEQDIYGNQKQLSEPYVSRENIELISKECIEWSLDKMEKEKYLIVSYDSLILIENKKHAFDLIKNQRYFLYVERFAPRGKPPSDLAYSLIDRFVDDENKCLDELNEKMDLAFNNYLSELTQRFKMVYLKDEATDNFVVIENQLEKTNHKHLGQILTYATGTKAVNIVWIASEFTGEHRATLDWLNSITDDNFNFFGLEVELYKISDSPVAPHFKIICQPNDWSKSINTAGRAYSNSNLSSAKQKHLAFWTKLASKMRESDSNLKPRKPRAQHWFNTSIGKSDFNLVSTINTVNNTIGAKLYIRKDKEAFKVLQSNKD